MKHLITTKILVAVVALVGTGFFVPQTANACGGQTASMGYVDDTLAAWTHEDGNPRAMDYRANIAPAEMNIPPALADAITQKYVTTYYPNAEGMDFHAFLFEHGDYVYMYDITDASIRNRSTVTACGSNPQKSESNSVDIHINAVTGDVMDGFGCGGGPTKVIMRYNADDYPAGLASQTKNLTQFHTNFVIPVAGETVTTEHNDGDEHATEENNDQTPDNTAITVDGSIDESEWSGAASTHLEQYGKTIEIKSKIVDGVLYWAVEANTKNWLALLLKTSPHHGMAWEFTDAKMLSKNGVEDYHVTYKGMMVGAGLEKDSTSTIIAQATSETESGRVYEFSMPLQSGPEGVDFQIGEYGNMAFYFGSTETFSGQLVYDDAFSKQMVTHVGKEIHRSVLSSIIPKAVAATFAGSGETGGSETVANQKTGLYLLLVAIVGVVLVAFRRLLRKLIKR